QSGSPIGTKLSHLRTFYRLGVRIIQLCYMERNQLGDGCLEPENRGLPSLGRQVVYEMNRLGMVIDLTHTGYRTAHDAIALSSHPCIISHANPRALADS